MARPRNYVFEETSLTIGDQPIRDYADGDSISVTTPDDAWAFMGGSHGSGIRSKRFDQKSEATIRLMPGSPMNKFMWAWYNEDKATGRASKFLFLKDPRADNTILRATAWITKRPDVAYGQELAAREWSLTLTDVEQSEGANELA